MKDILLLFSVIACATTESICQVTAADTLARQRAIDYSILSYETKIAGNSSLYNGVEYVNPLSKKRLKGHANFLMDEWLNGRIEYNKQIYDKVSLQYNLYLNKVLVENRQTHAAIELNNALIDFFEIEDHKFVRISSGIPGEQPDIFYELLFDDKVKVLVKRYKTMRETPDEKIMITELLEKKKVYLFKDEKYHTITNKKSALNVFGENKSEMKKFLSQNKINFSSAPETALVKMCQYYIQIL